MLEPCEGKLSCTVLRGEGGSNTADLLDQLIENKQKFISQIMTSKSPVRSCEDIDEAALTYAEVKALATGNPYIKEKMTLDIEVSKLKLLKAGHDSQRYRLEDNLMTNYPRKIAFLKEHIYGLETDRQTAEKNLPTDRKSVLDKEQFLMEVGGRRYTDKKEAGAAIIEMCKGVKTFSSSVPIGEYAGFRMAVAFDLLNNQFVMSLKGQLSHNLAIGPDPLGNITRINHTLESLEKKLAEARIKLEDVEHQIENARVEVAKPFAKERELAEKLERLAELNALLNMDEKGEEGIAMDDESEKPAADRPAVDIPAQKPSIREKMETYKKESIGGKNKESLAERREEAVL